MGHTRGVSSTPPTAGYPAPDNRPPGTRGLSGGQILAAIAGFLVLAAIGASLGWIFTTVPPAASAATGNSLLPSVSSSPSPTSTPEPSPSQPTSPPSSSSGTGDWLIPNFAANGTIFPDARTQLLSHGLQVILVFGDNGASEAVDHTNPGAGQPGRRGSTVKVYVVGAAPPLAVPPIPANASCADWGHYLVSIGFKIDKYKGSRSDPVTKESPDQNDPTVWGDQITLTCGGDNPPPSSPPASPSTTPPTSSPSPSGTP
jgi:hypothetical protein